MEIFDLLPAPEFNQLMDEADIVINKIINYEKNPLCEDSTEKLLTLFDDAVELAVKLIDEFPALSDEVYAYDFGSIHPGDYSVYAPKSVKEQEENS